MAGKVVNPLKTLGLDPEFVKSLSLDQLESVVNGSHRTLARLSHPDVNPPEESKVSFHRVNAAFVLLSENDFENLESFRDAYIKRRPYKAQIAELEGDLSAAETRSYEVLQSWEQYVVGQFSPRAAVGFVGTIHLEDTARKLSSLMTLRYTNNRREEAPAIYPKLVVEKNGRITKSLQSEESGTGEVFENVRLVGSIDPERLKEAGGEIRLLQRAGLLFEEHDGRELPKLPGRSRSVPPQYSVESAEIDASLFTETLQYVSPLMHPNGLLIALQLGEDGNHSYSIEGRIEELFPEC